MSNSSLALTKRRIDSVRSTLKITTAMKVVATAKLRSYKEKLGVGLEYAERLGEIVAEVLRCMDSDDPDNINRYASGNRKLLLFVTSSLGLCGAYNNNVSREFFRRYNQGDDVLVIGTKGEALLHSKGISFDDRFTQAFHAFDYSVSRQIGRYLYERFKSGNYCEVAVVGTQFCNSLNYRPLTKVIFPLPVSKGLAGAEAIEPDPVKVFGELLPQYINSLIYTVLLNSAVSEFGSRRNAMESASDNAEDIISDLQLEYNKARQGAITQEITEVVSGANALK